MSSKQAEILIVEDDRAIARLIEMHLQRAGYHTRVCPDGNEAMRCLQECTWQLVILDRMLPGKSGMQILRWLNRSGQDERTPVLMVTALSSTAERVQGLTEGADDYLSKPFEPEELVARVGALLRRNDTHGENTLTVNGICISVDSSEVRIDDQPLELSPLEIGLLRVLMRKPGKVRSREYLLDHAWGRDAFVELRTVDATVKRLRGALRNKGRADCIETVRGMGYRFRSP
ncbi:MAG: response regulator transcription factor [Mariprofundaceae bacterium]